MSVLRGLKKGPGKITINLFFLELIIVLLFFSVSGAVILRMFGAANALAIKNSISEKAVLSAQSLSEVYAATGDMKKAADECFGAGAYYGSADNDFALTLDESLKPLYTPDGRERFGRVSLFLHETSENTAHGRYGELNIRVFLLTDGGEEIYSHTSSAYIPDFAEEGSDE